MRDKLVALNCVLAMVAFCLLLALVSALADAYVREGLGLSAGVVAVVAAAAVAVSAGRCAANI